MALPLCGHTGRLGAINDRTDNPRIHLWASGHHGDGDASLRADGYNATHHRGSARASGGAATGRERADARAGESDEIIITAQKREENLQDVPISVQAIGTRRLDQLNISNFEDYTKQLPSVSFQSSAPGSTTVYMRGVASGGDGNHSGSFPSVGFYLDEQPVTTIGGTLDVHIYDIARIESLAGPQGTLYGASSQAGTIRIITNKPELGVTTGRMDAELNSVRHGGMGGSLEGMINLPIGDRMAFRATAFYQRDAGYIDNTLSARSYEYTGVHNPPFAGPPAIIAFDNSAFLKKNFNDQKVYGGRAALKIDLNENWTVTPTIMHQNLKSSGVFYMNEELPELQVTRFRKEPSRDKFTQVALTIEGKIANFDITYAGAYMDRPTRSVSDYVDYVDAYNELYQSYGYTSILDYQYYFDNAGNVISPVQYIVGGNHFKKLSQELRISSPADKPFRVITGAFYQVQKNHINQEYHVDGLSDDLSVNGFPGLLWLTRQDRKDKDYALFGEANFDVTPQITLTAGGRLYKFDNTLFGFAGYGRNLTFAADWRSAERRRQHSHRRRRMLRRGRTADPVRRDRSALRLEALPTFPARTSASSRTARLCRSGPRTTASSIA